MSTWAQKKPDPSVEKPVEKVRPPKIAEPESWPMDELRLRSGRVLRGLVETDTPRRVVLVEVQRPPGKPLALVIHPLAPDDIAARKLLAPAERQTLNGRLHAHKRRAAIEAGQMESVVLSKLPERPATVWRYDGPWFALESSADEQVTRRSIVRIEQVFMAYERVLPARHAADRRLRIVLEGSKSAYQKHVQELGLNLDHPAFYATQQNLIAAGGDLAAFGDRLATARTQLEQIRRDIDREAATMPGELDRRSKELEQQGYTRDERREILVAERKRWEAELQRKRQDVTAAGRRNLTQFDRYAELMFRRLYHEAFHAYLENAVYPAGDAQRQVPRWLNEGLAQVFESGLLEVDTLRIDAPDWQRLARLKADLNSSSRMRLVELVQADDQVFFVKNGHARDEASRHYLYSWGLAYYLVFGPAALDAAGIDTLARQDLTPVARLEKLTSQSLPELEARFRHDLLRLSPQQPYLPRQ